MLYPRLGTKILYSLSGFLQTAISGGYARQSEGGGAVMD